MHMYRLSNSWCWSLKYSSLQRRDPHHKTLTSQLPRRIAGRMAVGKWPSVCGMLLLLLWGTVATTLPRDNGRTSQDSMAMAEVKRDGLLTFLAWWHEWTSQASAGALIRGDAREMSKRQEGPPLQQPPRRDKTPCKNFFWKTFSSCK